MRRVSRRGPAAARLLAAALALAHLLAAGAALAEERPRVRLGYAALPSDCPDERAFRDMVAARLGYVPFDDDADQEILVVIEEHGDEELVGRLVARGGDGGGDGDERVREMTEAVTGCAELAESLALALAVMVDPLSLSGPRPPTVEPPEEEAQTEAEAVEREPSTEPETPVEETPTGVDLGLRAEVAMICSVGLTPGATLGGLARVALTIDRFSLGLEARAEGRIPGRGESVEVAVYQGGLSPCVRVAFFSFCAVVSAGAFQARAPFVESPRLLTSAYGSAAARVMAEIRLSHVFSLAAFAELSVPFVRASLEVDDDTVWAAPPVSGTFAVSGVADFL